MSKTITTSKDWQGDGSVLEIHSGGPLGVLFSLDDDGQAGFVSLRHEDVVSVYEQLGDWLLHRSAGPNMVRDPNE